MAMNQSILILAASLAPYPSLDDGPGGDLGRIQGAWEAAVGPFDDVPVTLTIEGDRFERVVSTGAGASFRFRGAVRLDEAAEPKRLDWVGTTGPGIEGVEDVAAIYRFEGENLIICSAEPGAPAPDTFDAGRGRYPSLRTYARPAEPGDETGEELAGDLAGLQGAWSAELGGGGATMTLEIDGRDVAMAIVGAGGQGFRVAGDVSVDESAEPKAIDLTGLEFLGNEVPDILGIYELEGDSLRLATSLRGGDRPEGFVEGRAVTLERERPDDEGDDS